MRRRLFLKFLGLAPAVASAKVPAPADWPAPVGPEGPWDCIHDKGEHACSGVAFRAVVMPIAGRPLNPAHFRLLDGSTPRAGDPVICGTCSVNLAREKVFPLSIAPRVRPLMIEAEDLL